MTNFTLKNFQSHKNTTITIDGFTIIKGSSNGGKSAIRRAISCLLFNEYDKSYIRNSATSLELELDDGTNIFKLSKPKNSYLVNGKEFPKIGKDVPEKFKQLGIDYFVADGTKHNLISSSQLDPLFMLTYSDQDNTRILNKIFSVERYELASKDVKKDKDNLRKENKIFREQLSEEKGHRNLLSDSLDLTTRAIEVMDKLESLDNHNLALSKYNSLYYESRKIKDSITELEELVSRYTLLKNSISNIDKHLGDELQLSNVQDQSSKLVSLFGYYDKLMNIQVISSFLKQLDNIDIAKSHLTDISTKINKGMMSIDKIDTIVRQSDSARDKINKITEFTALIDKLTTNNLEHNKTLMALNDLSSKSDQFTQHNDNIMVIARTIDIIAIYDKKKDQLSRIPLKIKELEEQLPETCPTCGQDIKDNQCH